MWTAKPKIHFTLIIIIALCGACICGSSAWAEQPDQFTDGGTPEGQFFDPEEIKTFMSIAKDFISSQENRREFMQMLRRMLHIGFDEPLDEGYETRLKVVERAYDDDGRIKMELYDNGDVATYSYEFGRKGGIVSIAVRIGALEITFKEYSITFQTYPRLGGENVREGPPNPPDPVPPANIDPDDNGAKPPDPVPPANVDPDDNSANPPDPAPPVSVGPADNGAGDDDPDNTAPDVDPDDGPINPIIVYFDEPIDLDRISKEGIGQLHIHLMQRAFDSLQKDTEKAIDRTNRKTNPYYRHIDKGLQGLKRKWPELNGILSEGNKPVSDRLKIDLSSDLTAIIEDPNLKKELVYRAELDRQVEIALALEPQDEAARKAKEEFREMIEALKESIFMPQLKKFKDKIARALATFLDRVGRITGDFTGAKIKYRKGKVKAVIKLPVKVGAETSVKK